MNFFTKASKICALFIFLAVFICCKRNYLVSDVKFLGHKGAGSNNYNEVNIENTIPSIIQALQKLDGVEADVAMSLDGTIWMYHNQDINDYSCDDKPEQYIPAMYDEELDKVRLCHKKKTDRLYKLVELISLWESAGKNFYISLDVKPTYPSWVFDLHGGRNGYYERFAEGLGALPSTALGTEKIMLEFQNTTLLKQLSLYEKTASMICYVTGDGDFDSHLETALEKGYHGISINYTKSSAEQIKQAKLEGLRVQLWTPYYRDDLRRAEAMNPDFLQTDNIYAKQALNIKN